MSKWNCREKETRRFRSREAFKRDLAEDSDEPWEVRRRNQVNGFSLIKPLMKKIKR